MLSIYVIKPNTFPCVFPYELSLCFQTSSGQKMRMCLLGNKDEENVTSSSNNVMENVIVQSTPYCILYACLMCLAGVVMLPRFKEKKVLFSLFYQHSEAGRKA